MDFATVLNLACYSIEMGARIEAVSLRDWGGTQKESRVDDKLKRLLYP